VPFFIDIYIDDPLRYQDNKAEFKSALLNRFVELQQQAIRKSS
jgi:hypothetical protein